MTNHALKEIALSLNIRNWDKRGPNTWPEVTEADYGYMQEPKSHDYELLDQGEHTVIYPITAAALQWCYFHLPEDCPRWQAHGFKVETCFLEYVQAGLRRDRLVSEDEYDDE